MAEKKTSKTPSAPAVDRAAHCSPPLLSVEDFESACSSDLNGNLWEDNFNPAYNGKVSLAVSEMRYIANALRFMQGKPQRLTHTAECCEANVKTVATEGAGESPTEAAQPSSQK